MSNTPTRIMIVEDEALIATDLENRLKDLGYEVSAIADSAAIALIEIEADPPDLVLLDIRLHGPMDGVELAGYVRKTYRLPIVFLTAHTDPVTIERAKVTEPCGFLVKPVGPGALPSTIEIALYKHRSEQEVRRRKAWLDATVRSVGDAVVVADAAETVQYINLSACALLGRPPEQCIGRTLAEVVPLLDADGRPFEDLVPAAALEECPVPFPPGVAAACHDGRTVPVAGTVTISRTEGERLGAVLVFRDIASRLAAEEELRREQRTLALGRLTASLSHDMARWLSVVRGGIDRMAGDEPAHEAVRNAARSAEMTARRLRQLAMRRTVAADPVNVGEVFRAQTGVMLEALPETVMTDACYDDRGALVRADARQLSRILLELVRNGVDVLPEEGYVRINTAVVTRAESSGSVWGDFVRITVTDNGPAISPDELERLFDSFSDQARPGCRRGLDTVRQTVTALGGTFNVESGASYGAFFEIYLPAVRAAGGAAA